MTLCYLWATGLAVLQQPPEIGLLSYLFTPARIATRGIRVVIYALCRFHRDHNRNRTLIGVPTLLPVRWASRSHLHWRFSELGLFADRYARLALRALNRACSGFNCLRREGRNRFNPNRLRLLLFVEA